MFKNETVRAGRLIKGAAVAAALAVVAIGSQASAATQLYLRSATMDTGFTANLAGDPPGPRPYINETGYSSGVTFTVNLGSSPIIDDPLDPDDVFNIYGFCVDIFHNMYLGPLGYTYEESTLTGDRGTPLIGLTATQIGRIATLVRLGVNLHATGNLSDYSVRARLAAIQAAIWQVENPLYTVTPDAGSQPYFTSYVNHVINPSAVAKIYTIIDTTGIHQSFAIAAVPEPATWTMMLAGFFGMGAMLRSRRKAIAAA